MSGRAGPSDPRSAIAVALLLLWLVGYPLLITLLEALGVRETFTLAHFAEFLTRPDEWQALWRSTWISIASVVLAAMIGVPLGFVFERLEFPGRRLLGALVALPVALPPLVGVIAFLFLYGESRHPGAQPPVDRLRGGALAVHRRGGDPGRARLLDVRVLLPVHPRGPRAARRRAGRGRAEPGRWVECGCSGEWCLPMLRPALAGAALLTFMTALASFSAPYIFGGGFRVMTTQIVSSKLNGQLEIAQVETVMLALLALIGLWGLSRIDRGETLVGGWPRHPAGPLRRAHSVRSHRLDRCSAGGWRSSC